MDQPDGTRFLQGTALLAAAAMRFANVATSFLRPSSVTSETALLGSTHWIVRCPDSGQTSLCRVTSKGKTLTSQFAWTPDSSSTLSYGKTPKDLPPTFPRTPASSNASRAADFAGFSPLIGHPFGIIHRFVCRVVTRRISSAASCVNR